MHFINVRICSLGSQRNIVQNVKLDLSENQWRPLTFFELLAQVHLEALNSRNGNLGKGCKSETQSYIALRFNKYLLATGPHWFQQKGNKLFICPVRHGG